MCPTLQPYVSQAGFASRLREGGTAFYARHVPPPRAAPHRPTPGGFV